MRAPVKRGRLLPLVAGLAAGVAHGFGAEGHRVAGAIAESQLCPGTRAWLAPLLDGTTLANAGTWADAIRDEPAWRHTGAWHFLDVADDESLARAARTTSANVLAAIRDAERELENVRLPRERRSTALRFYVHFVVDVHQPLHVGRPGDHGGNDVPVAWRGQAMSLHEFWDAGALLRAEKLDTAGLARAIGALALGEAAALQASHPADWAEESRGYRGIIYDLPAGAAPARLDRAYVAAARNVLSLRLAQAGTRLAAGLNRLGCAGAPVPSGQPSH